MTHCLHDLYSYSASASEGIASSRLVPSACLPGSHETLLASIKAYRIWAFLLGHAASKKEEVHIETEEGCRTVCRTCASSCLFTILGPVRRCELLPYSNSSYVRLNSLINDNWEADPLYNRLVDALFDFLDSTAPFPLNNTGQLEFEKWDTLQKMTEADGWENVPVRMK
jgi:hypothetical protein